MSITYSSKIGRILNFEYIHLKHNGEAVIKIYTIFDSISFIAYDYEILNPSELPYMLSDVKKTDYDSTILSINHWIE